MEQPLTGVLPVFQTPFNEDESIDIATLEKEVNWLYECGAGGIVMGMVSEVLRLSTQERFELAEMACRFGSGRGAVIISAGAESNILAERYAHHAEQCGAAAVMAIGPVAVAVGEDELLNYYRRIMRSVSIPVIVQDASGYVGRPMSIAMQRRLFDEFGPDRVMFKPEATPIGPRLTELHQATGDKARVFEGTGGAALVDSFRRGITGTMPGADLIRGIVALWRALVQKDEPSIYRISTPIASLIWLQQSLDAFLAIEKHLLMRQGIFRNTIVRRPVGYTLDESTRREANRLFDLITEAVTPP
jgi:dihydrodipicolinate synthase/N-acetylneuraminate lyase